jgi:hypothetical protein
MKEERLVSVYPQFIGRTSNRMALMQSCGWMKPVLHPAFKNSFPSEACDLPHSPGAQAYYS